VNHFWCALYLLVLLLLVAFTVKAFIDGERCRKEAWKELRRLCSGPCEACPRSDRLWLCRDCAYRPKEDA